MIVYLFAVVALVSPYSPDLLPNTLQVSEYSILSRCILAKPQS